MTITRYVLHSQPHEEQDIRFCSQPALFGTVAILETIETMSQVATITGVHCERVLHVRRH